MKLREQKRILAFLTMLESLIKKQTFPALSDELLEFFSDEELRQVIRHHHSDSWSSKEIASLKDLKRPALIEFILSDYALVLWTIKSIQKSMTATPNYEQGAIDEFFSHTSNEMHYLASKPVDSWDEYDKSNYRYLLIRTGTTKRVFGIYSSAVKAEDVYIVTTKPSYYFDTEEEAKAEIEKLVTTGSHTKGNLVVHSLWSLR